MTSDRRRRLWIALISVGAVLLAGVLLGAGRPPLSTRAEVRGRPVPREVTYCTPGGRPLRMDLYAPPSGSRLPAPAALFVHGGGWTAGDKRSGDGVPERDALLARGYLVAAVNYRLAPQYVFPAQIADVKCAVRYLRAHATALHLDPAHIGAWGTSAGGHLVSLLALAGPAAGLEGDGGYADQSSRVQAVVDMYGRADLQAVPVSRPDLLPIFGGVSHLRRYSPVAYVSAAAPPFLILHGNLDTTVPPALSRDLAARLRAAGVPVTLIMVQNAGHGFGAATPGMSPSRAAITQMVGDFFDQYLNGSPPGTPILPVPARYPQSGPHARNPTGPATVRPAIWGRVAATY